MRAAAKLKALKIGRALRGGSLLAHPTSTVFGIAASAYSERGLRKAQAFKQRKKPFLLLADSVRTALSHAVYLTPALRKLAKQSWPGNVTLVFRAKGKLNHAFYAQGSIAVRVDQEHLARTLAKQCGGLMLSSSLNRKGKPVATANRALRFRWRRHVSHVIISKQSAGGQASKIFKINGSKVTRLR